MNPTPLRNIEVVCKDGKYAVMDNGIEATPACHPSPESAIEEWGYFERLNTESEPHRRFLSHVTPIEFIEKIVKQYSKPPEP